MNHFDRFHGIIDDLNRPLRVLRKRQADLAAHNERFAINEDLVTIRVETAGADSIVNVACQIRQSEFGGPVVGISRHLMGRNDGLVFDDFQHSIFEPICRRRHSQFATFGNMRSAGDDDGIQVRKHARIPRIQHVLKRRNQVGCPDPQRKNKSGEARSCDDGPSQNLLFPQVFVLASNKTALSLLCDSLHERTCFAMWCCCQLQGSGESFFDRRPLLFQSPGHRKAITLLLQWHKKKPSNHHGDDCSERQPQQDA